MSNRIIRLALLAAVVAGAPTRGWSQAGAATAAKRPMTFEDLERMKRVSDPQISPSGKWVVFSATEADLNGNSMVNHLWVVPLGGTSTAVASGARELQMTSAREGEFGGRFSPNGTMLLFVANDGETGRSQIFVAPWDDVAGKPGTPKRLTNLATDTTDADWSPDSQRIMFTSRVYPECSDEATWVAEDACDKAKDEAVRASPMAEHVADHLMDRRRNHYVGPKRSHILVVLVANGNAIRDLTPRPTVGDADVPAALLDGRLGYAWAPDSAEVAFAANLTRSATGNANDDLFILKLNKAGARPEKVSTSTGNDSAPAYSLDGKWLAFRSQANGLYDSNQFRLMLYDRGMGTTTEVLPKFDRSINEFTWAPDSASIFFAIGDRGKSQIYSVAVSDENTIHYVAVPTGYLTLLMSGTKSESSELQISSDGTWLVSTAMSTGQPPEVFRTSLKIYSDDSPEVKQQKTGLKLAMAADKTNLPIDGVIPVAPEPLTHLNDSLLEKLTLEKIEPFWFAGTDGVRVQGFLIRPPGFDSSRKYPVKFLLHEEPHGTWGDAWSYRRSPQLMAADGYVAVMVNPRGSTGYGQAFLDGANSDWSGKTYSDLMKGMDYVEQHYAFIDKSRECVLGAGFGGLMADWILTHTNRFACIVTHDGELNTDNPIEMREAKDPEDAATHEPLQSWSLMSSIRDAKTPTLVVQSKKDNRLDGSKQPQLFKALQQQKVQSRILDLSGEAYSADTPQNSKLLYEVVGDWCDRWTKTNRYAKGFLPTTQIVTVTEPDKPQLKLPPPLPIRSTASSATETARTQPEASSARPSVATGASPVPIVQPAPLPVPSASAGATAISTTPSVQPRRPEASPPRIVPTVPPLPTAPGTVTQPIPPVAPAPLTSAQQNISRGSFAITISALGDELRVGEDARVAITLTNVSDHTILFAHRPGMDSPEFSFIFLVRNSAGHLMGENIAGSLGVSGPRAMDQIPPGGIVTQTAHLSKLVHLNQPGRYSVRVYRRDVDTNMVVQSNEVTLNLVTSMRTR